MAPPRRAARNSGSDCTNTPVGPSDSIEMTISVPATASAAVFATLAPKAASGCALAIVRFQTVVCIPAWQRLRAIGAPINPVPSRAIFCPNMTLKPLLRRGMRPLRYLLILRHWKCNTRYLSISHPAPTHKVAIGLSEAGQIAPPASIYKTQASFALTQARNAYKLAQLTALA